MGENAGNNLPPLSHILQHNKNKGRGVRFRRDDIDDVRGNGDVFSGSPAQGTAAAGAASLAATPGPIQASCDNELEAPTNGGTVGRLGQPRQGEGVGTAAGMDQKTANPNQSIDASPAERLHAASQPSVSGPQPQQSFREPQHTALQPPARDTDVPISNPQQQQFSGNTQVMWISPQYPGPPVATQPPTTLPVSQTPQTRNAWSTGRAPASGPTSSSKKGCIIGTAVACTFIVVGIIVLATSAAKAGGNSSSGQSV